MNMEAMIDKYFRPGRLPHIWCPGCGNGVVTGTIVKAVAKLDLDKDKVAVISGIGCSSRASGYLDFNTVHSAHGRALPVATGVKLADPGLTVIVVTGDGDATAIGGNHLIHAARRNIDMTVVLYNNSIYGMTGGQMAPTTLIGMKTATCPYGRDVTIHGYPLKMTEIAATLEGTAYVTRQAVHTVAAIRKAKKAIRKAFENSMNGKGSNLVEIVSTCNSGWKMTPQASNDWMVEHMFPFYPLGDLKDKE